MTVTKSALVSAVMVVGMTALAAAEGIESMRPEYTSDVGLIFPLLAAQPNTRTLEHIALDVNQHPVLMIATFGRAMPTTPLVEVLPKYGTYWAEYIGMQLRADRGGKFTQVVDQADKKMWDEANAMKNFFATRYNFKYEVVPFNSATFGAPESAGMVLMQKRMGELMRAGTLDKVLTAAYKSLKPGGTLLVEDYRAANDKPQDPKAANNYIREDYAIATIQQAGFRLADREDKLLANPNDPRTQSMNSSDRFLLKFTK